MQLDAAEIAALQTDLQMIQTVTRIDAESRAEAFQAVVEAVLGVARSRAKDAFLRTWTARAAVPPDAHAVARAQGEVAAYAQVAALIERLAAGLGVTVGGTEPPGAPLPAPDGSGRVATGVSRRQP